MSVVLLLFNAGYLCQHLGTFLQILRIENRKDIEGVSVDTQILFLIGAIARIVWITDTMLKDSFLTYVELALAGITLLYTLFICFFKYNLEYSTMSLVNNKKIPIFVRWYVVLLVCAGLSYFYYPGDEEAAYDIQMLVSLTIFTEAAGLLPQIFYVNKEKDSANFSYFYLIFLTISRIFRLCFWIQMYMEGNDFGFLMYADLIHLLMVSGFIWSFFRNLNGLSLPTNDKSKSVKKMF